MTLSFAACYKDEVSSATTSTHETARPPDGAAGAASARPYDLYLFDLDGTLVDSREDLTAAVNAARVALGLSPLPLATVSSYVGEGVGKLMERALGAQHADLLERATELFRAHYGEHLVDHTRAYAGAAELLRTLRERGARVAVVTNKPERFARLILQRLELWAFVEALVGGDTLPQRKPDPGPLLHACEQLGVAPARALMVGDSPIDAAAARSANVAMCAVTYGIGSRAELEAARPQHFAEHPLEVLRT